MASLKASSSEVVLELLKLISKPCIKRHDNEIEFVLPWLCKRSQLLQNQRRGVLLDIVKNCTLLSAYNDDIIIKQGDRGDSFYVILRGSASVYVDPKMTGEGSVNSEAGTSRKSANQKRRAKVKSPESVLSGMEGTLEDADDVKTPKDDAEEDENEEDDLEDDGYEENDELGDTGMKKRPTKLLAPLDRGKFGKLVMTYGAGSAFGELALVHRDSFRNATVVTNEDTDLMVIDQDLFDRSLRAEQEARYTEIRDFIDLHPFFKDMNAKFKKLLEMSIRKEKYVFDTYIIKQGDPVQGLHFLISGGANISIQPKKHQTQYSHLWPFEAGVDQIAIEFEHLREARRAAILRKYEDPSVWETKPEELVIRREQGYAAIEKKMKENHINLCSVQTREVLGDVEMLMNLGTYLQTVRCTSDTQCFVLDTKNFERLVSNKKNTAPTMSVMREYVKNKLRTRMQMRQSDLIPFLNYLHQKLTEQMLPETKKVEPFKTTKAIPGVEEEMQHLLQYFKEGKEVMLIKPSIPGVVYYKELMREKARVRAQQRITSRASDGNIKLGSVYKNRIRRQPRSMLQIRESLKQMMEAEVIEMETKKFRRKRIKQKKEQEKERVESRLSSRSDGSVSSGYTTPTSTATPHTPQTPNTPTSQVSRDKQKDASSPALIAVLKQEAAKRGNADSPSKKGKVNSGTSPTPKKRLNGGTPTREKPKQPQRVANTDNNTALPNPKLASNPNLPKNVPPVFVTEVSKGEIKLPAIREEKTQEEIVLRGGREPVHRINQVKQPVTSTHKQDVHKSVSETKTSSRNSTKSPMSEKSVKSNKLSHRDSPLNNAKPTKPAVDMPDAIVIDPSKRRKKDGIATQKDTKVTAHSPKQEADSEHDAMDNFKASVPNLPTLGGSTNSLNQGQDSTGTARTDDSGTSENWQTAISFVNQRVQDRLTKALLEEDTTYKDFESSEPSLKLLENRIKAFHIKYGMGQKTKNLPPLKRFKLDQADETACHVRPRPGGKVWVKKQTCRFADTQYVVKDHKHVRYQMVDAIPEFDRVQKSRVVVQQILKTAESLGGGDMF